MTKHYDNNDVEILPPSRPVVKAATTSLAPTAHTPYRPSPGGIVSSTLQRWQADKHADTYDAYARRSAAERKFVEADTELGQALIANQRIRQEYAELPQLLAADKAARALKRDEELRELCHNIEMAEVRRLQQRARAEIETYAAKQTFIDAEQKLDAQRQYGPRYHALEWEHRINEWELLVEEQRVVLTEHRRQHGRDELSLDDLHAARDQLNADGADTTPIDMAIARAMVRKHKVRK